jgi:mono/diheme cytochrome c family protein
MGGVTVENGVLRAAWLAVLVVAALAAGGCTADSGGSDENLVAGKQLFVQKCGACHTLARAGTKGTAGPNLDDAFAVARAEDWGDASIQSAVYGQILEPMGKQMPADLVTGDDARDVAAYVGAVAAKPGEDSGLLATAVKPAGSDKPAVAEDGVLTIPADPSGQLAYVNKTAEAQAGPIEVRMPNESGVQHDLVIEGTGIETPVVTEGVATAKGTLKAGTFTYFCSVPGHRAGGMEGKLTVK